jgi:lipopolysaccharide heptosyltransferase II
VSVAEHLQLSDWRERWLVRAADAALAVSAPLVSRWRRPRLHDRAILALRLERVGDLLMTLDALAALRAKAPDARIDLVVGSWNEPIARLIPGVDRVEVVNARWLARGDGGESMLALAARARAWRPRRYDLAINFEGDIRSNILAGLSGAVRRVGFGMAGGGPMLTDVVPFDPSIHTRSSSLRLVERAFDLASGTLDAARPAGAAPRLVLPQQAIERAAHLLGPVANRRIVVVQAGGGREVKQWNLERFAAVANRLAASDGVAVVLSGSLEDRPLVERLERDLQPDTPCIDLCGRVDLVTLAAVLDRADLLVTGDTGPMHLASALGTPLVAVFGPSDPARWGPWSADSLVVRAGIPCSPCNRIRRPPDRCRGRVPDCLAAVSADRVYEAAAKLLGASRR